MIYSCIPPKTFTVFAQYAREVKDDRASLFHQAFKGLEEGSRSDRIRPESSGVISLSRAGMFLLGGFTAGLLGGRLIRTLGSRYAKQGKTAVLQPIVHDESLTYLFFQKPLSSLFITAVEHPKLLKTFALYGGATGLGYLGMNLLQGLQEAWVRREETGIRIMLLERLNNVFQRSIRIKQQFDEHLRQTTEQRIRQVLQAHGIQQAESLMREIRDGSLLESPDVNRRYFYEPTHRTVFKGVFQDALKAEDSPMVEDSSSAEPKLLLVKWLDALFAGVGMGVGLLLNGIGSAFKNFRAQLEKQLSQAKPVIQKSIGLYDAEALAVLASHLNDRLSNKGLLLSYGLLVGTVTGAKLLVDGLREIEVTRVHAETEYRYQSYNWQVLDPGFHRIAEEEAVNDALRRLTEAISRRRYPGAWPHLQQRIQTILANIGRNSAPKYFPMTLPVGLREARS